MNKNYIILGGSVVAALATGATGGYFFAKKKFDQQVDALVDSEVEKLKAYYEKPIEKAKNTTVITSDEPAAQVIEEDELTEHDREIIDNATKALTDYKGISNKVIGEQKPPLDQVVQHNIFTDTSKPKKKLPPKDPATGRFLPKQTDEKHVDDPYIITHEEFLLNDPDHEQENLLYFVNDNTLIQVFDNEPVDIGHVHEVNLTQFPEVPDGHESIICVRNDGLQRDYEIKLMQERVTDYLGLGEEGSDDEVDEGEDPEENYEDEEEMTRSSRWAEAMGAARQVQRD